jgi:hypothetical protein
MKKAFLILFFLFAIIAQAQTDTTGIYRIKLSDDSEIAGKILETTDTSIVFISLSGIEMKIPKTQIKEMELVSGKVINGVLYKTDPNRTRLLFAPTGRMLKPGAGYFSVYEIFFPTIAVGLTNFLSISGGLSLVPGAEEQLYYFAPKLGYEFTETFSMGAGYLFLSVTGEDESAGILYTVATIGNDRNALTVGGGLGLTEGEISDTPVLMLGGELTVSNTIKLVSENWIITNEDLNSFISLGIRFFGEHLAADFALILPIGAETSGFPALPWVGFVYNF